MSWQMNRVALASRTAVTLTKFLITAVVWISLFGEPLLTSATCAQEPKTEEPKPEKQEAKSEEDKSATKNIEVRAEVIAIASAESPKLWLGVLLKNVEGDLAKYLGSDDGVLVDEVFKNSPAEKAGIKMGDVLLVAGKSKLSSPADLLSAISDLDHAENKKAQLDIELSRMGKKIEVSIAPGPRPENASVDLKVDREFGWLPQNALTNALSRVSVFQIPDSIDESKSEPEANGTVQSGKTETVITISRSGEMPARITVRNDDETLEYTELELENLPAKIQETVKQYLKADPSASVLPSRIAIRSARPIRIERGVPFNRTFEQARVAKKSVEGEKADADADETVVKGSTEKVLAKIEALQQELELLHQELQGKR